MNTDIGSYGKLNFKHFILIIGVILMTFVAINFVSVNRSNQNPPIRTENNPWPMHSHDPRNTCRSPYRGLTQRPQKPKWIVRSPGGSYGFTSSIAIGSDGKIYAGTAHNE